MKNVIIAFGMVVILILTVFVSLTIYSNNSRQNEVEEALTVAVEQALENLMVDQQYTIADTKEFIADFVQRLVVGLDSESEITVNILAVDTEKGLLDVEVVETYRQVNGTTGTASYRKTVILDAISNPPEEVFTVVFMVEETYASGNFKEYKKFTLTDGTKAIFPGANPALSGHNFAGWSLTKPDAANNYSPEIVTDVTVTEDLVFYAVFD